MLVGSSRSAPNGPWLRGGIRRGKAHRLTRTADDRGSLSMAKEACDSYEARVLPDDRSEFRIVVPSRFADPWLVKLSDLRAGLTEVRSLAGSAPDVEPPAAADGGCG